MKEQVDKFLQETLEFWQARTERILTIDDAREIAENLGAFFEILLASEPACDQSTEPVKS